MGRNLVIAFFFAATDSLYWLWEMIFHLQRVPPPKDPVGPGALRVWTRAAISGIGGVAGAYAIAQLTGATDLLTALAGAYIGGRLVGGALASFTQR